MKLFSVLIPFLLSTTSFAATSEISAPLPAPVEMNWSVEGQFNTISNSSTPTFGPSILYALNPRNQIGFRLLAPASSGSRGTTSVMSLYRYNFSESTVRFFTELSFARNFYEIENATNGYSAPSVGTNLGVTYRLTSNFSFGGVAGFEWTRTFLTDDYAYESPETIYGYARLGLFGSLQF